MGNKCHSTYIHILFLFLLLLLISAITDFTITQDRSKVITFAQPITQIFHSLFIKNPTGALNYKAYIEPLHYTSWIVIALFCILTPPFLHITTQ